MSHIKNKIRWCINKTKKEIQNGKKHKGLLEIQPDIKEAKKHIIKAEWNLSTAIYLEKGGYTDWAISAVFYTIYHCFLAILVKHGYESRNQDCTIALIDHLNKESKFSLDSDIIEALKITDNKEKYESNIIDLRENYQYGTETEIDDKLLSELKELCIKSIEQTKKIIFP